MKLVHEELEYVKVKEYYDRLIEWIGEELEGSEACNWIKGLDV